MFLTIQCNLRNKNVLLSDYPLIRTSKKYWNYPNASRLTGQILTLCPGSSLTCILFVEFWYVIYNNCCKNYTENISHRKSDKMKHLEEIGEEFSNVQDDPNSAAHVKIEICYLKVKTYHGSLYE